MHGFPTWRAPLHFAVPPLVIKKKYCSSSAAHAEFGLVSTSQHFALAHEDS